MLKVGVQQGAASGGDTLILVLTENSGEAKVTEFDDLLFGDENVFRFDISMDALKEKKKTGKMESLHRKLRRYSKTSFKTRLCFLDQATLLNGGLVAFVVSRWDINCWTAEGKEFLLNGKKTKKKWAIKWKGSWRKEETWGIQKPAADE